MNELNTKLTGEADRADKLAFDNAKVGSSYLRAGKPIQPGFNAIYLRIMQLVRASYLLSQFNQGFLLLVCE